MTTADSASSSTAPADAGRWALVTARDIMRKDVVTVSYASPLSEVERVLSEHRISGAPVTDEAGHIIGILSVKDLVARYAENSDARPRRSAGFFHLSSEEMLDDDFESFSVPNEAEETAGDLMTGEVYSVHVDASLKDIAGAMKQHKVHRLLVQDDGRYVGLLSTMEILDALSA